MIFDADKTLIPEYMQNMLCRYFEDDIDSFWDRVKALQQQCALDNIPYQHEAVYLSVLLDKFNDPDDPMYDCTRDELMIAGSYLEFFPGVDSFFDNMRAIVAQDRYALHDVSLDFYVVSSGLADMLRGSFLSRWVGEENIYGCEFLFEDDVPVHVRHFMSYTEKTKFLFMVNKGVDTTAINNKVPQSDRSVPISQMMYFGDGPTDVPMFSIVDNEGGLTFAVYGPDDPVAFENAYQLRRTGRVMFKNEADYRKGSALYRDASRAVSELADLIVRSDDSVGGFSPSF